MIKNIIYLLVFLSSSYLSADVAAVIKMARTHLERGEITYKYGGNSVESLSLDCTHFIQQVFKEAGHLFPYLTTKDMLALSDKKLLKNFSLQTIRDGKIIPADILVYEGHAVIVEKVHPKKSLIDLIHATSGKEIKGEGEGVQRARMVDPSTFRGPLLRVLRFKGF